MLQGNLGIIIMEVISNNNNGSMEFTEGNAEEEGHFCRSRGGNIMKHTKESTDWFWE